MRFKLNEDLNLAKLNSLINDYKNSDMYRMILEAKSRGISTKDVFKPCSIALNALEFFNNLTEGTDENYQLNAFKRIFLNRPCNLFYQIILNYLNDRKGYKKLDPAKIKKLNNFWEAIDGRHRAALCILLEIPLPIEEL